ncbi:MAG TPA: hypothetical protein VIT44_08310 [Cyclobacteriaceae bacterium]
MVNTLSLDVAGGAVICATFFADLFQVNVLPQGLAALGLAVWIVYTADHLLDAKRLTDQASTFRHRFHQRHFKPLTVLLLVACLIEFILLFFLRKPIFYNGLWLGLGVVIYVMINRWLSYFKEVAGALLYCGGVLLPTFSLKLQSFQVPDKLILLQFLLIVFTNLVLFSWMDYENDVKDRHRSLITLLNKEWGRIIIWFLFVAFFALNAFTIATHGKSTILFFVMELMLFLIFLFPSYFKNEERFRFIGDAIFFLPIIAIVL